MSAVADRFAELAVEGRPALVGYWPAGFPTVDGSIQAIEAMILGGVDIVEVGLPYSDPVMDGPTIQEAAQNAISDGFRVRDTFAVVKASVAAGVPTVVMTYWNPVEKYGVDEFATDLAAAEGSGLITPDIIPEEAAAWTTAAREHNLDQIFLVAPSSTDVRLAMTAAASSGFVYATAVMGVTGRRQHTSSLAPALVQRIRKVSQLAVGVGLGVSNGDQAAEVGAFADAVIVGSAFVRALLDAPDHAAGLAALTAVAADLRAGVDRARRGPAC